MMINIKQIKGLFKELQDLWTAIKAKANSTTIDSHIQDKNNPHGVSKHQVGLSNVENTSDKDKPISEATKKELDQKANANDLHTVATSGSYNDLEDKPTIPVVPPISKVGLSGDYNDLEDKPTIPVVPPISKVGLSGDYNDLENKPTIPVIPTIDKEKLDLEKVNNTSDEEKPVSIPQQQALDNKLNKDGSIPMTGPLLLADGGFAFNSDGGKDTGMFWLSDGKFAAKNNNVQRATFEADGRISGVANPDNAQDVATKNFVDYKFKTRLTPYTDLNNYTNAGLYYIDSDAEFVTINNRPSSNLSGFLEVIGQTHWVLQRYTVYGDTTLVFTRRLYNGAWSAWKLTNGNMQPKAYGLIKHDGSVLQYFTCDGSVLTCSKTGTGTYRIYCNLIINGTTIVLANTVPGIDANISAGSNGNGQILIYAIRNSTTFIDTYFSFMFI